MATAKKKETTELAPVENKTVALRSEAQIAAQQASAGTEVVASDVIVPRLVIAQSTSPMTTSRKAQLGDMRRSTTLEKLGDPENPVKLIPIAMQNAWTDYQKIEGEQPKFMGQYPRGVTKRDDRGNAIESNEDLPWTFKGPKGEDMMRKKTIILYALVPSDFAAYEAEIKRALAEGDVPDLNIGVAPVVISFQSTSFKYGGKQIATFFSNLKQTNANLGGKLVVAPFDYVLELSSAAESKGKNTWYVFKLDPPVALSKVYKDKEEANMMRERAAFWTSAFAAGRIKAADSDDEVSDEGGSSSSGVAESEV